MSITRATPVRSLPGEAILPQSECRARCVLWTLYHKAGRKGSAARGKRKKICLFRQTGLYIPCGKMPALSGLPIASHLPQRGRRVFPPCRGLTGLFHVKHGLACPKPWAGKSACPLRLAYGKPPSPEEEASFSILPWGGRFVSRESRMACLKLWAERALALSGLPWASHLPQRGRRVSAPCRGFTGLIHVKRKRQRSFRLAASPVGNE